MNHPKPHPGHVIHVTPTVFGRAVYECSCGEHAIFASRRAATAVAISHHHDAGGCNCPPEVRAAELHPDPDPASPGSDTASQTG